MSQEQEQAVLEKLESKASQGQVLKGAQVKDGNRKGIRKDCCLENQLSDITPQRMA